MPIITVFIASKTSYSLVCAQRVDRFSWLESLLKILLENGHLGSCVISLEVRPHMGQANNTDHSRRE